MNYTVYRGVAKRDGDGKNYLMLDLLITTPYENVAKDHALKCPSPLRDNDYIQSMIVISPHGEVSSYPMYHSEKK